MDFNYQTITPDGVAVMGSDAQLLVKFSTHAEISQIKSKAAGMPIYDDVEIVTIMNPGEKEPVIVQATDWHRHRFPRQYEAFKKGKEDQHGGTPLEMLFVGQPSTVKQLQAFHIFTIQQLANISDTAKSQIPMGQSLVDRAKAYLSQAGAGQGFHAMEEMQRQIDALKAKLGDAGVDVPEMPAVPMPQRRGPGRHKAVKPELEKETT